MVGRIPSDVRRIYEKSITQSLLKMNKCDIKIASVLAKEAIPAIRDPRTGMEYVKRAAQKMRDITVAEVGGRHLIHKDPSEEKVDTDSLKLCAGFLIRIGDSVGLAEDEIEEMVKPCSCRCRVPAAPKVPELSKLTRPSSLPEAVFESMVKMISGINPPPGPQSVLLELQESFESGKPPRLQELIKTPFE